jgi:hypothetical protein
VASLAGTLMAAPKDEVQGAVKKLGDAGSYSWTSTTTNVSPAGGPGGGGGGRGRGGFCGGGPMEGKLGKDGIAYITSTSNFGGNPMTMERVVKGDKTAMKNQDGAWQTPEEMMAAFGGGGAPGGGRGRGGGMFGGAVVLPAAQAADLLSKVKDVTMADGAYSGDLTEDGAKSLMAFGGRGGGQGPDIAGAKGSVKFWLKDGVLAKYEFTVQGTMSFGGNDMPMNRTTTIEIKDVGTTTVTVPDEAKKKVS